MYGITGEDGPTEEDRAFEERLLDALRRHLSVSIDRKSDSDSYGRRNYTTEVEIFFKGVPICNCRMYS